MSWTQPVCEVCWTVDNTAREPFRMKIPEPERCCYCGHETESGIYVRVDPTSVPYPSEDD